MAGAGDDDGCPAAYTVGPIADVGEFTVSGGHYG